MSTRTSIFLFAIFLASTKATESLYDLPGLDEVEYPGNFTALLTLKEFVDLVEKNDLNVTLIVSQGKKYEEGNLKEEIAFTFTFPVNNVKITSNQSEKILTKAKVEKLFRQANEEKIAVVETEYLPNDQVGISSNYFKGVPLTKAFKIFTGISQISIDGFIFNEENYVSQFTFAIPGADGKNTTTKVFYGDVNVEVIDKSPHLKDEDLAKIKKALVDAIFTFDETLVPRAIVSILSSSLPEHSWDAVGGVGVQNYVDSDNWVLLRILTKNYLIYSS